MIRFIWLLVMAVLASPTQADVLLLQGSSTVTSPSDVVASPDSAHLYAANFLGNAIEVLARNSQTGALMPVESKTDAALVHPLRMLASGDGKFVYVITRGDSVADSLLTYARGADGKLTFVEALQNGSGGITHMSQPSDLALSPSGDQMYARASGSGSLLVFSRNIATGKLALFQTILDSDTGIDGLAGEGWLAVSADGFVYTTSISDNSVTAFARSAVTNQLALVNTYKDGTGGVSGLSGAWGLAVAPDAKHLYVAGGAGNAVALFTRDATSGELSFQAAYRQGDANQTGDAALSFDGLQGPLEVAVSPDGQRVYVNGGDETIDQGQITTLAVLRRDSSDGTLSFVEVHRSTDALPIDGFGGALRFAISPDGEFLYSAGIEDNKIGVFQQLSVDLSLVVLDESDPINLGDIFSYAITLTNNSQLVAHGVAVTNVLPPEVSFVSVNSASCAHDTGVVKCDRINLLGGAHTEINIQVTAPATETQLHNDAVVFSQFNDTNHIDNNDQEDTTVVNLAPNVPPVAVDDVAHILPGSYVLLDVVANDHDDDGDTLSIVDKSVIKQTDASRGGKLLIYDDTRVAYWPQAAVDGVNFTGTETFSYSVSDGNGGGAEGLITIVVNTPPIAVDDEVFILPGKAKALDILGNDQDVDGDSLAIVAVDSDAVQGTLTINGGTQVSYTPPVKQNGKEFTGMEVFVYRVMDENGEVDEGLVTVVVNTDPVAENDSATIPPGSTVTISVLANDVDPDGDAISIASVDDTMLTGGSVHMNGDGTISYTAPDSIGAQTFYYTIEDGNAAASQAQVTVQVEAATGSGGDNTPLETTANRNGGGGAIDLASMLLLLTLVALNAARTTRAKVSERRT